MSISADKTVLLPMTELISQYKPALRGKVITNTSLVLSEIEIEI